MTTRPIAALRLATIIRWLTIAVLVLASRVETVQASCGDYLFMDSHSQARSETQLSDFPTSDSNSPAGSRTHPLPSPGQHTCDGPSCRQGLPPTPAPRPLLTVRLPDLALAPRRPQRPAAAGTQAERRDLAATPSAGCRTRVDRPPQG